MSLLPPANGRRPGPLGLGQTLADLITGIAPGLGSSATMTGSPPFPMPQTTPAGPGGGGPAPSTMPGGGPIRPATDVGQVGPRLSKGQIIAGILADGFAGALGQQGTFGPMWAKQREQARQQQAEQVQWHRNRAAGLEDYEAKQRIDQRYDSKPTDQFTQYLTAAGVDPASPQGRGLYLQRVASMANPPRYMTGPNGEILQVGGGLASPSQTPRKPRVFSALPEGAIPVGGAESQAPHTFR